MKLAFCLFKYFPYGGLQRDFLRIAKTLCARGHAVHVYTMQWEGPLDPDLIVHEVAVRGLQNHTRLRSFIKKLGRLQLPKHYDKVIGFNKMPGLHLYYAADTCYVNRLNEKYGPLHRLLPRYRQLVSMEKAVFAKGTETEILLIAEKQQALFSHFYQTEAKRFHHLPPGIAKDRLAPNNAAEIRANMRNHLNLAQHHLVMLFIGSRFKTKGLDRAIRAFAALPKSLQAQSQLVVIGDDHAKPFQTLAHQLQVSDNHIHFLGARSDIPHLLLTADLLLHPAYHENTGTVLLEALAAGLPVLTVDHCGYAHYVQEAKAGVVLPSPFQQKKLDLALQEMLVTDDRHRFKQNAYAFAKHADIYGMAEKAADIIEQDSKALLSPPTWFDKIMSLSGECFRHQKGRLTQRISLNGKSYFLKQYHGVGIREIFKNLLQGRFPIISATNECLAIYRLQSLGVAVPEVVSYGLRGRNPARLQSFMLMEEITPAMSLEDLAKHFQKVSPSFVLKFSLIKAIARIAKILHENGMNHRDFYLCHFLLAIPHGIDQINPHQLKLYLIDLHRSQIRRLTPMRFIIKDLSSLYFSSMDVTLTLRDYYRFMRAYHQKPLRVILKTYGTFWQKVKKRGKQLYRDHH